MPRSVPGSLANRSWIGRADNRTEESAKGESGKLAVAEGGAENRKREEGGGWPVKRMNLDTSPDQ